MDNALRYTSIMRGVQCHEFSQGTEELLNIYDGDFGGQIVKAVNYICERAPSKKFYMILNTPFRYLTKSANFRNM